MVSDYFRFFPVKCQFFFSTLALFWRINQRSGMTYFPRWHYKGTFCFGLWPPLETLICSEKLISGYVQWKNSVPLVFCFLQSTTATYLLIKCVWLFCSSLVLSQCTAKLLTLCFFFAKVFFRSGFAAELAHKVSGTRCHVAIAFSSSCTEESSALELMPVAV